VRNTLPFVFCLLLFLCCIHPWGMDPNQSETPSNARGRLVFPPPSDQPFLIPQIPSIYAPPPNQQFFPHFQPLPRSPPLPRELPYQRDLPPQRDPSPESPIIRAWNIPPRPRPGRKPAQDIPPTKRKQQNRDAQRAFRERRAAKVGELEGVIQGLHKDFGIERALAKAKSEHKDRGWRQLVDFWKGQSVNWEATAKQEKQRTDLETRRRVELEQVLEQLRKHEQQSTFRGWNGSSLSSFPTSNRSSWDQISPTSRNLPPLPIPAGPASDALKLPDPSTFVACRDCGQNGRCFCMEKVLHDLPEPILPNPGLGDTAVKQQDEMEIDFTGMGKKGFTNAVGNPIVVDDVAELPGLRHNAFEVPNRHVDNQGQAVNSPPVPATGEWPRRVSLQERPQPVQMSGAPKGPGTCHFCINDPERKRFCESLATLMPAPFLPPRNDSMATPLSPRSKNATIPLTSGMTPGASRSSFTFSDMVTGGSSKDNRISCAEAYDILSKDPNFAEKRDNKSYMENLKAQPAALDTECETCKDTGCSVYEVDCASILHLMSTYNPGNALKPGETPETEPENDSEKDLG